MPKRILASLAAVLVLVGLGIYWHSNNLTLDVGIDGTDATTQSPNSLVTSDQEGSPARSHDSAEDLDNDGESTTTASVTASTQIESGNLIFTLSDGRLSDDFEGTNAPYLTAEDIVAVIESNGHEVTEEIPEHTMPLFGSSSNRIFWVGDVSFVVWQFESHREAQAARDIAIDPSRHLVSWAYTPEFVVIDNLIVSFDVQERRFMLNVLDNAMN